MPDLDEIHVHPGGPYVQAAFLCERVLTEADGTNSYIRNINSIGSMSVGPDPTSHPLNAEFTLTLILRKGQSEGSIKLTIQPMKPSGEYMPPQTMSMKMHGAGLNIHLPMQLLNLEEGQHYIRIEINDKLVALVPFGAERQWMSGPSVGI